MHLTLIAPRGDLRVRLPARVARLAEGSDDGEAGVAVEFLELEPAQKEALESLLSRLIEGTAPEPLESLRPGAPPHEVRKALEAIPLPHRISLAARGIPRDRELLRHDPHPQVIESLARNPSLLVAEARALAVLPHLLPTTLDLLATDPRWGQDAELRMLILAHPRTPPPLADRLLQKLQLPSLRALLQRSLPALIREKATKRLRQLSS